MAGPREEPARGGPSVSGPVCSCYHSLFGLPAVTPRLLAETLRGYSLSWISELSQGCWNRLPQIWWLKTTKCILSQAEARRLKTRCRQDRASSKGSGPPSFRLPAWLQVPVAPVTLAPSPPSHGLLLCVCGSSSVS